MGSCPDGYESNPRELFRLPSGVDLLVKKVRHRAVVELNGHGGTALLHEPDIFDQERIMGGRDSEAADFGGAEVAPEQQFRPSRRRESETRTR